jgi:hypothetical protein
MLGVGEAEPEADDAGLPGGERWGRNRRLMSNTGHPAAGPDGDCSSCRRRPVLPKPDERSASACARSGRTRGSQRRRQPASQDGVSRSAPQKEAPLMSSPYRSLPFSITAPSWSTVAAVPDRRRPRWGGSPWRGNRRLSGWRHHRVPCSADTGRGSFRGDQRSEIAGGKTARS